MPERPKGAFIRRDKKTYAIVPRTLMGMLTPDILENMARVARKYEIPIIKITSAQRMALVGLKRLLNEKILKTDKDVSQMLKFF